MKPAEAIDEIRAKFVSGAITPEDLLYRLEPVVNLAANGRTQIAEARKMLNDIELAIFTNNDPQRSALIAERLGHAVHTVAAWSQTH